MPSIRRRWAARLASVIYRIPVATVLRLLAGGLSEREILSECPDLEVGDIRECLRFAAASAMERKLPLPYSA
jgi:uncharacterized protein (DUF433 family)